MTTAVKTSIKINLHPFKLCCIYLDLLSLSNVGNFPRVINLKGSIQVQNKKRKLAICMFTSSIKLHISRLYVKVVQ